MTTLRLHPKQMVIDQLKEEARRRKTSPSALATTILRLVVEEDLYEAVIGDSKIDQHATATNRGAWTARRVAKLRKLAEEGYTAREMAARLGGVSRNAVIGKADRLGIKLAKRKKKRPEE